MQDDKARDFTDLLAARGLKPVNINLGAPTPAVEDEPYFPQYDWRQDPLLEGRGAPPGERPSKPDKAMFVRCRCGTLVQVSLIGGLYTQCSKCHRRYSFTKIPRKPVRATLDWGGKPPKPRH